MTEATLTTPELLEVLGDRVTRRQLYWAMAQSLVHPDSVGTGQRATYAWDGDTIRRLQVAAALDHAVSRQRGHDGGSSVPSAIRAVFGHAASPAPRAWAVWREHAVSYVIYPADLFRVIGEGAVVARIEELWPESPPTEAKT